MTWLFVRFYLGVLAVLFAAWWIVGIVFWARFEADQARVYEEAHAGGARLAAAALLNVPIAERPSVLRELQRGFAYPLFLESRENLAPIIDRRLNSSKNVVYISEFQSVVTALDDGQALGLGPFPNYTRQEIEGALAGWMKLAAQEIDDVDPTQRKQALEDLQGLFEFPIELVPLTDLPDREQVRMAAGSEMVFFGSDDDGYFVASPLQNGQEGLLGGPLPRFGNISQFGNISATVGATTFALVLMPAALAIAILLRPVAQQLRRIETAAKTFANGDLSARVDERRVPSAKQLAAAFNQMAIRTEGMVKTQTELLQAVSHELRTPLTRIRFGIDLIEAAGSDDERKERLKSLDQASEELDELVGELLQYVRLGNAEPTIHQEHINIDQAVDMLITKNAIANENITFEQQHSEANAVVFADPVGLHRVLGNLLSNASRFAKTTVTVSSRTSGNNTVIEVDDDGIGIDSSERIRVFEPFVRLEQQGERGGGVGLGLALVKRILENHGGRVEISEAPQGGCRIMTFWPQDPSSSKA